MRARAGRIQLHGDAGVHNLPPRPEIRDAPAVAADQGASLPEQLVMKAKLTDASVLFIQDPSLLLNVGGVGDVPPLVLKARFTAGRSGQCRKSRRGCVSSAPCREPAALRLAIIPAPEHRARRAEKNNGARLPPQVGTVHHNRVSRSRSSRISPAQPCRSLPKARGCGLEIRDQPVVPRAARRIRIVDDQSEALRPGRFARPLQGRRQVSSVAGETLRNTSPAGKPLTVSLKGA